MVMLATSGAFSYMSYHAGDQSFDMSDDEAVPESPSPIPESPSPIGDGLAEDTTKYVRYRFQVERRGMYAHSPFTIQEIESKIS